MQNLAKFIDNSDDPIINLALGQEYENIGQTGAAISFYLRTAERSTSDLQQYDALMRCCICLEKQKTRDDTEKGLLLKSIALIPSRPEAYFLLSRVHEKRTEWQESYTMATLGLLYSDFDSVPMIADHYPGYYGLLFQKGVASWWVGLTEQSRQLMQHLRDNYHMLPMYRTAVENNIKNCGLPKTPLEQAVSWNTETAATVPLYTHTYYDASMKDAIRLQFDGLDSVDKNFSQSYQDLFVLAATKGKRNGTYLEIGSAEPFYGNNTALLETKFGWTGLSIELDSAKVLDFSANRNNKVLCVDATTVNYAAVLENFKFSRDVDYLQVDCDPPEISFDILKRIPFDQYRFAVITFEHDYYWNQSVRDQSRAYLKKQGYELLVSDLAYNKIHSYEDWWVHPALVDSATRASLRAVGDNIKFATDYMLPTLKSTEVVIQPKLNVSRSTSAVINPQPTPGVWIVDNFYKDPDAIRKFALEQQYDKGGLGELYIGDRTSQQFLFPGLKEEFEYIMNRKITRWEEHGMNGKFQLCKEGEPLAYHCDDQKWAAMLYLTPDAPYQSGTSTHALKGTDVRHISHPDIMKCFRPGSRNLDRTIFEPVDSFGNVYNRLVIFNAGYIHSATDYFGFNQDNCRLWQMFFFD